MPTSATLPDPSQPQPQQEEGQHIRPLQPLTPDLHERAWHSSPHPTLPLLATVHARSVTVFSLTSLTSHSTLQGGHTRSVRSASWKPGLPPHKLCLVTGSFDSTAGVWRWDDSSAGGSQEVEVTRHHDGQENKEQGAGEGEWEFTLVLEGHDSEIKSCVFSPSGAHLATCSRDKSIWIWEDIGASEADDEWETIAVLTEHEGDVKSLAWCPDVPGRNASRRDNVYGVECLASASYDDTVRVWREDGDAEWVCVAVLEGHGGTVWGVEWEGRKERKEFPRLLTYSADGTIKIWTLHQPPPEDNDDDTLTTTSSTAPKNALGGIPNTMRRSTTETWTCTATLPKVHTSDVYSASWSPQTGLVASTGSDGKLVLYKETETPTGEWEVLEVRENAHGPFEVNHVTWCKRWDRAAKEGEEMLVTTGDDGVVRPWEVVV